MFCESQDLDTKDGFPTRFVAFLQRDFNQIMEDFKLFIEKEYGEKLPKNFNFLEEATGLIEEMVAFKMAAISQYKLLLLDSARATASKIKE
jgi:hypothetical protein